MSNEKITKILRNAEYANGNRIKSTDTVFEGVFGSLRFNAVLTFTMETLRGGPPVYRVEASGEDVYLGDGYGDSPEEALTKLCKRKFMATNVGVVLGFA
jgi:hypothetical protein